MIKMVLDEEKRGRGGQREEKEGGTQRKEGRGGRRDGEEGGRRRIKKMKKSQKASLGLVLHVCRQGGPGTLQKCRIASLQEGMSVGPSVYIVELS